MTAPAAPTKQSFASVARQVIAVLATVYGVLSAESVAPHLPGWAAGPLIAFGPVLLAIEHYVSDPSTGNAVAAIDAVAAAAPVVKVDAEKWKADFEKAFEADVVGVVHSELARLAVATKANEVAPAAK